LQLLTSTVLHPASANCLYCRQQWIAIFTLILRNSGAACNSKRWTTNFCLQLQPLLYCTMYIRTIHTKMSASPCVYFTLITPSHTPLAPAGCGVIELATVDGILTMKVYSSCLHCERKCARTRQPLKLPSPTKLARLGHFPQLARRSALPARCSMFIYFLYVSPLPTFVGTFYNLGGPKAILYCTLLHTSFANVSHCLQGGKNKNFILTFAKNTAWFYLYIFNMYNNVIFS
jgi:hypothetical protein